MENLQSGVILKLLSDMDIQEKTVIDDDCKIPALLQITSIIPVLSEGDDLWPKQGFFIKVSDSTQELFVSLPQEQDEMVLKNELQIGQFIYVKKLESAYPVPLLKGLRPIPGRKPFDKDFKELVGIDIMETLSQTSPFQRVRSISPYKAPSRDRRVSIGGPNCWTRTHGLHHQGFDIDYSRKKQSREGSSCSRRSWCETTKTRTRESQDSTVVKRETVPVCHGHSSHALPIGLDRSFSYKDDNSNTRLGIKDVSQSSKQVKSANKSCYSSSARTSKEPLTEARKIGSSDNKIRTETEMLWEALPSSLIKLGKEVLRQRDVTLLAAVQALQEAAATERLLKCLSKFSELRLAKEGDQQTSINKFFKLQNYMSQCRTIVQSLTNISPGSTREGLKLAVDRSINATAWVKAAVASDLIPLSAEGKNEAKKSSQITMLKGGYTIMKQKNNGEFHCDLGADEENIPKWVKGSSLNIARNLADSLQDECKTWFLAYMENYLDGFDNKCLSKAPHSQVAESMCQIKRLNDWLDMIEESNGKSTPESYEIQVYGRVRNKIYEVLLKHVERTATALEKMNVIC